MLSVSQETTGAVKTLTEEINGEPGPHKVYTYMDKTCAEINAAGWISMDMSHSVAIVAFAILSMLTTGTVALMMRNNKQLMAHPNKLIFYMYICEGIVAWQAMITHLGPQEVICYFGLETLY